MSGVRIWVCVWWATRLDLRITSLEAKDALVTLPSDAYIYTYTKHVWKYMTFALSLPYPSLCILTNERAHTHILICIQNKRTRKPLQTHIQTYKALPFLLDAFRSISTSLSNPLLFCVYVCGRVCFCHAHVRMYIFFSPLFTVFTSLLFFFAFR